MCEAEWKETKMTRKVIWSLLAGVLVVLLAAPSGICDAPSQATMTSPGATDMNCSACHDKHVKSMMDSTMHVSAHAKAGINKCNSCHDTEALKESHANVVPGETKFVKARRYPHDFCLKCHGTYGDLAKRTPNSKVLTDNKGRVVNPHDIPKTPKHRKVAECGNCHKEHKKAPDVMRYCTGCHHTGEFSCGKCHPA